MKILIILLLVLGFAYRLALNILQYRSAENPIPENAADVYDSETYARWRRYSAENCRLSILSTTLSFLVALALLCTNAYAAFAAHFSVDSIRQMMAVILLEALADSLVGIPIRYYRTMVIEEKYGFNRSSRKTFFTDQILRFVNEYAISYAIAYLLAKLHPILGYRMIPQFALAVFGFSLVASFLYPLLSRIGNKFVRLEEGELKDSLMALLTRHGYKVKAIEVMDASRRTTKLNAYFTGFGRMKTIVLFDNLLNAMSTEEICAVFSHELGHGLNKDVLKMQIMNFGNLLLMALVAWLSVCNPALHRIFGFDGINYGFGYILIGIGLGLVQPLSGMALNAYSRRAEFRADRQAVTEGYGSAMITALKKLARENFSHLAPSPINVILEYSHPPLSQRIAAVEQALGK